MNLKAQLAAGLIWGVSSAAFAQNSPPLSVQSLGFMSGCWTTPKGAPEEYRECYTAPYAGIIQGSSHAVKNQKTVSFEFSLIAEKDGKVTYTPFYNGKQLSVFTLTKIEGQSALFENPENDFPKKLIYRRNADRSLTARTEGASATDAQNQEWTMIPQGM